MRTRAFLLFEHDSIVGDSRHAVTEAVCSFCDLCCLYAVSYGTVSLESSESNRDSTRNDVSTFGGVTKFMLPD